jgi:hypothetical protein
MSGQPEKQARAEAMLGEVAELAVVVTRELVVRLRESEDTQETVALTDAFQKATRVLRLTLALNFKLDRDAAREARDLAREAKGATAQQPAPPAAPAQTAANRIERRKMRVHNLLNRLLWTESEGDSEDYDILFNDLAARLDEAALSPDFETLPIEVLARRMIADMGLSGELTLSLCETPASDGPLPQPPPADTG